MTSAMTKSAKSVTTAVVGLGLSGMSCLRHLQETDSLVVIDNRQAPANLATAKAAFPGALFFVGKDAALPARWRGVERVVLSPGVAANDPMLEGSESLQRLSDIDLFMQQARAPVIGITGTNGKSTVTALVGHILDQLGVHSRVGGNLGEPALDLLDQKTQVYVLELSSFQIEHSKSLNLAAAAVLNLSPDHLDRHGDLKTYAAIKRRIFESATRRVSNADDVLTQPGYPATSVDVTFGRAEDAQWRLSEQSGQQLFIRNGVEFARASDFSLHGQHNLLNLLAAFAIVADLEIAGIPSFDASPESYVAAASTFSGLAHRAEFVRELDGVRYINDSKATNVGACAAALAGYQNLGKPTVVLLAGGQGKGADFTPLGDVASCVKLAILFGEDAPLIEQALAEHTNTLQVGSFEAAVSAASDSAVAGDTVLLAPACASFDMFSSFTQRGERFCELVEGLS